MATNATTKANDPAATGAGGPDCGDSIYWHDLICRNIGTQGLGLTTEKRDAIIIIDRTN